MINSMFSFFLAVSVSPLLGTTIMDNKTNLIKLIFQYNVLVSAVIFIKFQQFKTSTYVMFHSYFFYSLKYRITDL